ncbi:hypothetical protein GCM10022405_14670 [Gibbsiella dentisursi]|uniref:Uncharacterized protein n=1 Tax=Gibbsiella dentisursi TaxID=796890 RepID=A0ABP7KYI1_9GAMM
MHRLEKEGNPFRHLILLQRPGGAQGAITRRLRRNTSLRNKESIYNINMIDLRNLPTVKAGVLPLYFSTLPIYP